MKMLRYELKKVFSQARNRMAVLLMFVLFILISMMTINKVWYVDENGNERSGILAARNLRVEKNKWKGYITEEVLEEVVKENASINHSGEALSEDIVEQDKAFAKKQGFSGIADIINQAFSAWRDYNPYAIDSISAEQAKHVYEKRVSNLQNWFDLGEETYTEAQKEFLLVQYENLNTPFYYEYLDGWSVLLQSISTFILILALFIGFFVSGIFSDEFHTKADSVFFSTRLGRSKAVASKMGAGFLITTILYVGFVALYTMLILFILGADGGNCPIQLEMWRCIYNITLFQAYIFIVAGGYIGTLLAATLAMLVSALTHSTATAIIVPFIILCAFPFLSRIITLPQVCSFFPDQLLNIYTSIKESGLVELGGRVMGTEAVIMPVYMVVCILLWPVLYGVYRKTQIK